MDDGERVRRTIGLRPLRLTRNNSVLTAQQSHPFLDPKQRAAGANRLHRPRSDCFATEKLIGTLQAGTNLH